MKYCPKKDCAVWAWTNAWEIFCEACGTELTPCIKCLCGHAEYNPKAPPIYRKQFCPSCGIQFTEVYLGQCMAAQLGGMVKEIAAKQADYGSLTD